MPDDEHDQDARDQSEGGDLPPDSPAQGVVDEETEHLPEPGEPG